MAIDPTTGAYKPDDPTQISQQLTGLIDKNNPVMKQAASMGFKSANRRGLLNSTMGVQAGQDALYRTAVPIASQQAQQATTERIAGMNVAANDREKAAAMAAAMENSYSEAFRTIGQQNELPADVRDKYLTHIGKVRDSNLALVEQMYGITLDWETPTV